MIVAYEKKEHIKFPEFIKNRLARIYPLYFLALLLAFIFKTWPFTYSDFLINVLMIQSWIPDQALTVNYPGWSLSVELFFYCTFPFLFNKIYSKYKLRTLAIWIVVFWLGSQIVHHLIFWKIVFVPYHAFNTMQYYPLMHFNQFLIGNLTGLLFVRKLKQKQNNYSLVIIAIISILILIMKFPLDFNFHNGLLAIIFIPLILAISLSNDKFTKFLSTKFFIFLGEISFGIYILQVPVWLIFNDVRMGRYFGFNVGSSPTISFLIRLLILVLFSAFSYLYFEKPIRNKIKNFGR